MIFNIYIICDFSDKYLQNTLKSIEIQNAKCEIIPIKTKDFSVKNSDYSVFINSGDKFSENYFKYLSDFINKNDVDVIFAEKSDAQNTNKTGLFSVNENINVSLNNFCIKTKLLKKTENIKFTVLKNIAKTSKFGFIKEAVYFPFSPVKRTAIMFKKFRQVENFKFMYEVAEHFINEKSAFFRNILINFLINFENLVKKSEFSIMPEYKLAEKSFCNVKNILDENLILNSEFSFTAKKYLIEKYLKRKFFIDINEEKPSLKSDEINLEISAEIAVFNITEEKGKIIIKGNYNSFYNDTQINLRYNDTMFTASQKILQNDYNRPTFFYENICDVVVFTFEIPFETDSSIEFFMNIGGRIIIPKIEHSLFSPFNQKREFNFCVTENLIFSNIKNILFVERKNDTKIKAYIGISLNFLKPESHNIFNFYSQTYKNYAGREIYIFSDRIDRYDDNGWVLYNYARMQNDNAEKYFIIGKKAYYQMIKKFPEDKNILMFEDIKTQMLIAFASKWIMSVAYTDFYTESHYFRPFFTAFNHSKYYFLQHGIIKDDVSKTYNGLRYNFSMFVVTTQKEFEYVNSEVFGYENGIVKKTGLPRLDNRIYKNPPEKIITFCPTWRAGMNTKYNLTKEDFLNTDYYKYIADFLFDEKLIENVEKYNYKIILKLHPQMSGHSEYFENISDNIIVGENITYEEIFEKSCLMITDYSSAVFDFVYSGKPIIYYQKIAEHHSKSYFDYEKNGFGEIINDTDKLINKLIKIFASEELPKIAEKYQKNIDLFFDVRDDNNCQRTYNSIIS